MKVTNPWTDMCPATCLWGVANNTRRVDELDNKQTKKNYNNTQCNLYRMCKTGKGQT